MNFLTNDLEIRDKTWHLRDLPLNERPVCLGCGWCCLRMRCSLSRMIHGNILEQCPELYWDDESEKFWCMLVVDRKQIAIHKATGTTLIIPAADYLDTGQGCLVPTTWRMDVKERGMTDAPDARVLLPRFEF